MKRRAAATFQDRRSTEEQITLGELIEQLETRPLDHTVCFDFGGLEVGDIGSYRGYYDELAIGFSEDGQFQTVAALLMDLRKTVGARFEGYKGGTYYMRSDTPLWVANYGHTGSTIVVGLRECDYMTVIATAFTDQ